MISLYGKPTRRDEATKSDSLFVKELGMPLLITWECNNISLRLRVNYGANDKALNVLEIQIRNARFEMAEELEGL